MENESLWLPDGYGLGTIIYDNENNPYEATKNLNSCIYEITPVEKDYAEKRIQQGAKKLVSTNK